MSHEPDIYGYLATTQISGITTALLDDSTKNTYANKSSIQFWKGPISIWATVRATRTYPGGLPIPEESIVVEVDLDAAGTAFLRPLGTEIWQIVGISAITAGGTATVSMAISGGGSTAAYSRVGVSVSTTPIPFGAPGDNGNYFITNGAFLMFLETGGTAATVTVAYHKVSL